MLNFLITRPSLLWRIQKQSSLDTSNAAPALMLTRPGMSH